jgi:hypothetical protein
MARRVKQLVRFLGLSTTDKMLLGRCLLAVTAVRLGLSLLSYRALRRWLPKAASGTAASETAARRIVWGVDRASRLVPGATCLVRAVAAQAILARAGYHSQVRIGVNSDERGNFIAHAWLIGGDRVLLGGAPHELDRYVPLADFGPEPL